MLMRMLNLHFDVNICVDVDVVVIDVGGDVVVDVYFFYRCLR